jgi:hypothetical protein|tara:strand:- start:24967 stop:25092 length:126 start_codon:yes stop_codon:yes gene_type:complete
MVSPEAFYQMGIGQNDHHNKYDISHQFNAKYVNLRMKKIST